MQHAARYGVFTVTPSNFEDLNKEEQDSLRSTACQEGFVSVITCRCKAVSAELHRDWEELSELGQSRRQGQWLIVTLVGTVLFFLLWFVSKVDPTFPAENKAARTIAAQGPLSLLSSNSSFRRLTEGTGSLKTTLLCEAYGLEFTPYYILLAQILLSQMLLDVTKGKKQKQTRFGLIYLCYQVANGAANIIAVYILFLSGNGSGKRGSAGMGQSYEMYGLLLSQSSGVASGFQLLVNGQYARKTSALFQNAQEQIASMSHEVDVSQQEDEDTLETGLVSNRQQQYAVLEPEDLAATTDMEAQADTQAQAVTKREESAAASQVTAWDLVYHWLFVEETSWDQAVTCDAAATVLILPLGPVLLSHHLPMGICYIWVWILAMMAAGVGIELMRAGAVFILKQAGVCKKYFSAETDGTDVSQLLDAANSKAMHAFAAALLAQCGVVYAILLYSERAPAPASIYAHVILQDFNGRNFDAWSSCILQHASQKLATLTQVLSML
jgi:hypothetical protein